MGRHARPCARALPAPPGSPGSPAGYLKAVEDVYVNDAYHSLSIEGHRISPALIERVRRGGCDPDGNAEDRGNRNPLAAAGQPRDWDYLGTGTVGR